MFILYNVYTYAITEDDLTAKSSTIETLLGHLMILTLKVYTTLYIKDVGILCE